MEGHFLGEFSNGVYEKREEMRLNERKKQFKKIPSIFREDRDKETVEEEKVIG